MYPVSLKILLGMITFAVAVPSIVADTFPVSGLVVSGKVARLHRGQAAAPKKAPVPVKRAIWAANQLRSKPYRYGGGHKSFDDRGYDCSGTVSYVLGAAGLIASPMSSSEFRIYGQRGRGKWITVYAREGHTFAVIAGLRLDTTPWDNSSNRWAYGSRRRRKNLAGKVPPPHSDPLATVEFWKNYAVYSRQFAVNQCNPMPEKRVRSGLIC